MTQNKHSHRRRRYFIKKGFQFRFIIKFCLLILIGVVISTGLLLLLSQDTLTSSFSQSRLVIKNTALAILPAVIYTNLITLGLITLATIIVMMFISHTLAGPIFRFENELMEIGEGDLTKDIVLRKKDQITDIADSLNMMSARLREKMRAIQTEVESIIESAAEQETPERLAEELKSLDQMIRATFKI
jgi:methyl-accepting chemotaxis protein